MTIVGVCKNTLETPTKLEMLLLADVERAGNSNAWFKVSKNFWCVKKLDSKHYASWHSL